MPDKETMVDPRLLAHPGTESVRRCKRCNLHIVGSLSGVCEACLMKQYLAEELQYAEEVLSQRPLLAIEVARDRKHKPHLVLFRNTDWSWCGVEVWEERRKRRRVHAVHFPLDLCADCTRTYIRIAEGFDEGK